MHLVYSVRTAFYILPCLKSIAPRVLRIREAPPPTKYILLTPFQRGSFFCFDPASQRLWFSKRGGFLFFFSSSLQQQQHAARLLSDLRTHFGAALLCHRAYCAFTIDSIRFVTSRIRPDIVGKCGVCSQQLPRISDWLLK